MDLCNQSCLFGWQECFIIGHYTQPSRPNSPICTMLIGTIDHYHFILLSVTLTLPEGHKVSRKQNMLAAFSQSLLN